MNPFFTYRVILIYREIAPSAYNVTVVESWGDNRPELSSGPSICSDDLRGSDGTNEKGHLRIDLTRQSCLYPITCNEKYIVVLSKRKLLTRNESRVYIVEPTLEPETSVWTQVQNQSSKYSRHWIPFNKW